MTTRSRKEKLWLAFGGLGVVLLAAAAFTLGSLNLPVEPRTTGEMLMLFALSTFIFAALLVFGLVLTRNLLRIRAERRAERLGARFKTKMVMGAMGISLLPVIFLFFISYALLNRTLNKWFPRPLEIATAESQSLLNDLGRAEHERLSGIAERTARSEERGRGSSGHANLILRALGGGADAAWTLNPAGSTRMGQAVRDILEQGGALTLRTQAVLPSPVRTLPSGLEVWQADGRLFLAARAPLAEGEIAAARRMPDDFLERYAEIERQAQQYGEQRRQLRAYKTQMLLVLLLPTVLLMFSATWFALFLSKQVTVPIQALAEATREVSEGNFDYRVRVQAQDELGILVNSFNQMTAQLAQSQSQIQEFTKSLQEAIEELERRRKLMETILENIPTGVLSLDSGGQILRVNPAVAEMFGEPARTARTLSDLLGEEAARGVQGLMRKSLRMGTASQEFEIALRGRVLHAAIAASSLGPRRANPGYVLVIDDLTELLRAQKAAAWQEVAQRIAHEIKNPLTPIQLSAQRLAKHVEEAAATSKRKDNGKLTQMVAECATLIEREVGTLESLVEEFSQFARFPTARLVPTDVNEIVRRALEVFAGRLEGVALRTELAADLPPAKADPDLLKRVMINLIDNAAEAMEGSPAKELTVETHLEASGETLEIVVADTGRGISPEDKDKLFLPHFSTKVRGTGLGLAIASRIIAEHHGSVRVEDNSPVGARFVIRVPAAELPAAPLPPET